jgi:hypothetical protein
MAKLKKGSDAAKAWGKKMKAYINKPVLNHNGKVKPKMSKKNGRKHGKKGTTFHVVPDLLYAGAAATIALPLVDDVYDGYKSNGYTGAMKGLNWYVTEQMAPAAVPAAELAIAGIVIQKVAKWIGLNKIGTKDVKVF